LVEHTIDTGDAKPVKQPPRRVPIAFAEEEKKLIMQMQEQGIIRKSSSPWSLPQYQGNLESWAGERHPLW
jgi:hypothetical protein